MMWMEVLQSIWRILQNPTVIVAVIGALLCAYLWVGNIRVESKLNKSNAEVTLLKGQLEVTKNNQRVLMDTVSQLNGSQGTLKVSIKSLQKQIKDEQNTTEKWIKYCTDKPVEVSQVSSKPYIEKGVIVDEKSSVKYIDYINGMFKSKSK